MKSAVAIRHVPFEDLGSLGPLLEGRGFEIRYVEAPAHGFSDVDPAGPDLAVILGGPVGAYETAEYPFLAAETEWITRRLSASRPLLGLCLGSQLIAQALGARVYPSGIKEIGWSPVTLTDEGARSCLAPLAPAGGPPVPVLHWHGDTFDLPDGARHLASTDVCANQAFSHGGNVLAVQFHPEVTAPGLESWFVGHACEIAATPDVDVPDLRRQTEKWAPGLERTAPTIFSRWLETAGL